MVLCEPGGKIVLINCNHHIVNHATMLRPGIAKNSCGTVGFEKTNQNQKRTFTFILQQQSLVSANT